MGINTLNKIIGISSVIIGTAGLSFFIIVVIRDIFFPNIMYISGFASDLYLASWIYLILLIFAGFNLIKKKPKVIELYQFISIGFIIQYLIYKIFLGEPLINNPLILFVYFAILLYFNHKEVKLALDYIESGNKFKTLFRQIFINLGIIVLALTYYFSKVFILY